MHLPSYDYLKMLSPKLALLRFIHFPFIVLIASSNQTTTLLGFFEEHRQTFRYDFFFFIKKKLPRQRKAYYAIQ